MPELISFYFLVFAFLFGLKAFLSQNMPSLYPWIALSWSAKHKRLAASKQYSRSISIPKNLRFSFLAVTMLLPTPIKGSKTNAPSFVLARISFAISFSGFCVGWSVFSGIDQKGTVISFQRFDGCVMRYWPVDVLSQSLGMPLLSVYGARTLRFNFTFSTLKT